MAAVCTTYDCACPVGQALRYNGTCYSIAYTVDTTLADKGSWNAS